jgi:hypothetical protein
MSSLEEPQPSEWELSSEGIRENGFAFIELRFPEMRNHSHLGARLGAHLDRHFATNVRPPQTFVRLDHHRSSVPHHGRLPSISLPQHAIQPRSSLPQEGKFFRVKNL